MGGASQSNSFSNIAMLNNAAAMVFIPRYSIETAYLRDPQFGWKTWITSLIDTTNRAFAGGLTYVQSKTNDSSTTLHQIIGSSGFALGQTISAGFNVRRIQGKGDLSPSRRRELLVDRHQCFIKNGTSMDYRLGMAQCRQTPKITFTGIYAYSLDGLAGHGLHSCV